jgi:hypothetical protein
MVSWGKTIACRKVLLLDSEMKFSSCSQDRVSFPWKGLLVHVQDFSDHKSDSVEPLHKWLFFQAMQKAWHCSQTWLAIGER